MKLYRVLLTDKIKEGELVTCIPKVPKVYGFNENITFSRICFAPSILQCVMAIPNWWETLFMDADCDDLYPTNRVVVLEVDSEDYPDNYISNEEIYNKHYVEDCRITGECWITTEVQARAHIVTLSCLSTTSFYVFYKSAEEIIKRHCVECGYSIDNVIDLSNFVNTEDLPKCQLLSLGKDAVGMQTGLYSVFIDGVKQLHPYFR